MATTSAVLFTPSRLLPSLPWILGVGALAAVYGGLGLTLLQVPEAEASAVPERVQAVPPRQQRAPQPVLTSRPTEQVLLIQVNPPDATVRLDGAATRVVSGNVKIDGLPVGRTVRIDVAAAGFVPTTRIVTIHSPFQTLDVALAPAPPLAIADPAPEMEAAVLARAMRMVDVLSDKLTALAAEAEAAGSDPERMDLVRERMAGEIAQLEVMDEEIREHLTPEATQRLTEYAQQRLVPAVGRLTTAMFRTVDYEGLVQEIRMEDAVVQPVTGELQAVPNPPEREPTQDGEDVE